MLVLEQEDRPLEEVEIFLTVRDLHIICKDTVWGGWASGEWVGNTSYSFDIGEIPWERVLV